MMYDVETVCICCVCVVQMSVGGVSLLATTHTGPQSNVENEEFRFCPADQRS